MILSNGSDKSRGTQCCYDGDGELTRGPPCAITDQAKPYHTVASAFIEFLENSAPYLVCCVFAEAGDCSVYQTLGMLSNDSRYIPPNIGKFILIVILSCCV